ncbi:phospholipid-transporting ATPase 8 [Dorcoceras hygrometricum]|uniref:Phospholipid-transporting ATPase 8 n=1 Tax=Dorcoceras hygrometricum TaxID=472368 RepID=A0A2Z7D1F0_9LAMI|nr:phospholipid-transporting ATPase 8 [Dorcoceras hygrometricum]
MAPFAPRTHDAAAIRMKQIVIGNQSRTIRRLRAKLATERRDVDRRISQMVEAKKEHKSNQVDLEASHTTIVGLNEIGLCMSKKIERMKAKKQQARESHLECHQNESFQWQNMAGNRRSDSNNGGEGSSNSEAGLSREDLMAIATIVATTLQGLVNTNISQAPPPIPPPHGTKYYYKSLRKNRAPLSMGTMTTKLPRPG